VLPGDEQMSLAGLQHELPLWSSPIHLPGDEYREGFWEVKIHGSPNLEILELDPIPQSRLQPSWASSWKHSSHNRSSSRAVRLAAAPH